MTAASARHIAIVCSGLGAGGAERVIALLTGHFIVQGARVTIIAFDHPDDPIFHPLPDAVRLCRLGGDDGRASASRSPARRILSLRRLLRSDRPDIVISFLTKINLIALIATIGMRVPVIACERNNPERQQAHPLWNLALRLFYRRAAAILCQTEASLRCIPTKARARAVVIPNPIEQRALARGMQRSSKLAAVGRLTRQKGFDLLLEAFARVAGHHPQWHLDIWGEGPERAMLEQRIDAPDLRGRVRLRGLSAEPGGWLEHADAFVLSSRYEGFPNVLGEAMAAGLPVLATQCDFGPADMIVDGESGILVEPDTVETLSAGLDRLLGDAPLRDHLGRGAVQAAQRFSPMRVLAQWDALLEAILTQSVAK